RRAEEHVKGMVTPGTLFEELGFSYFGPIDGHNLGDLLGLLRNLQNLSGPRMLHIVTRKGQGYPPAEEDACKFHGVGPFDPETGDVKSSAKPGRQSYTSIFSDWLVARGQQDTRLHAITPAMREGSGLVKFSDEMPDRYHDVGIAEQHAVTLAAGMARDGLKPVVAIYSTFLQRAYDQFIHDVAVQNLDVTFAIDRAGVVGADGATHTGNFDIAFCRCIPDVIMMAPANAEDMYALLNTAYEYPGPALVRYPRDNTAQAQATDIETTVEIGTAVQQRSGKRAALLVFGSLYALAEPIAEELDLSLVNMRFIKPLDEAMIERMAGDHDCLVTLEDASVEGGAGSGVLEVLNRKDLRLPVLRLGLADCFPSQGSREQVLEEYGLDPDRLREAIAGFIGD
ncbi:MAG: 1-deoxy-D-xylulose-5-phosphate synthase, partial [Gammaproteobacteria bacterium]